MTLDLDYVRSVGEDVHARLFPRPAQVRNPATGQLEDGPVPYPVPVSLRYQPADEVDVNVLFVSERSIQVVDDPDAQDVPPTWVRVVLSDSAAPVSQVVRLDLELGKEPSVGDLDDGTLRALAPQGERGDAVSALFRAVAGVL